MEGKAFERVAVLTKRLNHYRYEYYNLNVPSVDDEVYDRLLDELARLEETTGLRIANSPTQTVGYAAVSALPKTTHSIPLLSLDKTKSTEDLVVFAGGRQVSLTLKLDGLTVKLTYEGGKLLEAATRGDGTEGEVITHNVKGISGIPDRISCKERLVVTGEAFIRPSDFEELRTALLDNSGRPYKNGRNLAAGSVRLLDAAVCKERRVTFMPFNVLEGFEDLNSRSDRLSRLREIGFQMCKSLVSTAPLTKEGVDHAVQSLREYAKDCDVPIDGIVVSYDDIAYSKSCGRTGHHYKDGLAFKFEDALTETVLRMIEWTPSRTGEIAPVAIFDPVEIDGCEVSRASLHNLSFIERLELIPGCRVLVSKRNMIIPQVEENLDHGVGFTLDSVIPHVCPCCGQPTRVHINDDSKSLFCDDPNCETRHLKKFVHFAGKKAMDIEGLSEATLERLIGRGWLHSYMDIYRLDERRAEIVRMDGFGEKSWQKLWDAIQRSRNTTFERYLIAMDIPMVGNTVSRVLARQFHSSLAELEEAACGGYDFTQLPDVGEMIHKNICQWFQEEENWCIWTELQELVHTRPPEAPAENLAGDSPFAGLTIVVTGKVEPYTRSGIHSLIESLGATAGSSVSSKTNYLVCGEKSDGKLDKARQLGIPVLTPAEFFRMAGAA